MKLTDVRADGLGTTFLFSFSGAGATVTACITIDDNNPIVAEAYMANLMQALATEVSTKRHPSPQSLQFIANVEADSEPRPTAHEA